MDRLWFETDLLPQAHVRHGQAVNSSNAYSEVFGKAPLVPKTLIRERVYARLCVIVWIHSDSQRLSMLANHFGFGA